MRCNGQRAAGLLFTIILIAAITLGWGTEAMGKYLTVDEQSTYIDVHCDGYIYRIYFGNNETIDRLYDPTLSVLGNFYYELYEEGNTRFGTNMDRDRIAYVTEATPTRVVVKRVGNFEDSDQNTLTNSDSYTQTFTFYSDRIVTHLKWVTSDTIDIDNNTTNRIIAFYEDGNTSPINIANISSTEKYHEEDGANDPDLLGVYRSSDDYIGFKSTEINITGINIEHTDDSNYIQRLNNAGDMQFSWNDADTFPAGTHTMTVVWLIDSADRENDGGTFLDWDTDIDTNSVTVGTICEQSADSLRYICHTAHTAGAGNEPPDTDYWWEYRMTLGDQAKDLVMAAPTTGSEVTDLVIPMDLSSDGFATDGGRHLEMASDEIKYTVDIARIGHVDVIEDPPIETGTVGSATDHLVGHWKMDDNAASTTVVDATGNNNGALSGGKNTEDITNSSSVRGSHLSLTRGDYDVIHLNDGIQALADDSCFTIEFWFKPQYNYDTSDTYNYLFSLGNSSTDRIFMYYHGSLDSFYIQNDISNAGSNLSGSWKTFTSNLALQQWYNFQLSVDLNYGYIHCAIDGVICWQETGVTDDWGATVQYLSLAGTTPNGSGLGSYGFDNVKIINGCMLPYGAYFTGNGAVDPDHAHEDITFLWQGADATPIGTDVTNDGGDYSTDGPIGTKAFDNSDAGDNASAATSGNISAAEGSMSFWFKPNSALGADCTLFYADSAFKVWWDDSDNDVVFTYNTDVLNMGTAFAAGDTSWHHVEIKWKASDSLYINVDGLVTSLLTGVDAAPTLDATMFFTADDADGTNRADVLMSDVMITDTMGTPQIPVILGSGPIHAPIQGIE